MSAIELAAATRDLRRAIVILRDILPKEAIVDLVTEMLQEDLADDAAGPIPADGEVDAAPGHPDGAGRNPPRGTATNGRPGRRKRGESIMQHDQPDAPQRRTSERPPPSLRPAPRARGAARPRARPVRWGPTPTGRGTGRLRPRPIPHPACARAETEAGHRRNAPARPVASELGRRLDAPWPDKPPPGTTLVTVGARPCSDRGSRNAGTPSRASRAWSCRAT